MATQGPLPPMSSKGHLDDEARRAALLRVFQTTRSETESLAKPLSAEDAQVQSMPDASPTKWHLAHVSWFFETFVLQPAGDYELFDRHFGLLFNSYYNSIGQPFHRPARGLLTRPSLASVLEYRAHVDRALVRQIQRSEAADLPRLEQLVLLGVNHEEQHQELLLTDILHVFSVNPLRPAYLHRPVPVSPKAPALTWHRFAGGLVEIGHHGDQFAFDNEGPRHQTFLREFELASRAVLCDEYLEFIADGGYRRPELWLSDGWSVVQNERWSAPLYWERRDGRWHRMTLYGRQPIDPGAPVCHVSYYEADAFARWSGARLPTEAEWELAALPAPLDGNLRECGDFIPLAPGGSSSDHPDQLFGDVWEWTSSPYTAYPGYQPTAGALGEYNGKFMCNQLVLRGGSCVTPLRHIRSTYRNFFYPHCRWQFMGLRLARDA